MLICFCTSNEPDGVDDPEANITTCGENRPRRNQLSQWRGEHYGRSNRIGPYPKMDF